MARTSVIRGAVVRSIAGARPGLAVARTKVGDFPVPPPPPPPPEPEVGLDDILLGPLMLTTTFESISIEVTYTGDDLAPANDVTATMRFKKTADGDWRTGLPPWRTVYGIGKAFYGSVLLCDHNTSYDVEVTITDPGHGSAIMTGSVTTRNDNIPAAATLTPTRYVKTAASGGSDAADGLTADTAWATIDKALLSAPSGAVVRIGPGIFTYSNRERTTPITLMAQYPSLDDDRIEINAGNHTIIDSGVRAAAGSSTWEQVVVVGATTGLNRNLWKWTGTGITATELAYAASTTATTWNRVAWWSRKPGSFTDALGRTWRLQSSPDDIAWWADFLYANDTYNYGFARGATAQDIYARFPLDIDPNDYHWVANNIPDGQTAGRLRFNAPNVRLTGLELHLVGVLFSVDSDECIVDHNILCNHIINYRGTKPGGYSYDGVAQYNIFRDTGLTSADQVAAPSIPWKFLKQGLKINSQATSFSRIGAQAELTAVMHSGGNRRHVFRYNTVDGVFNGIGGYSAGYDGNAKTDQDVHDNLFQNVGDDVIELDFSTHNWRVWNNRVENSSVFYSVSPLQYGPLYIFRNTAWQLGSHRTAPDSLGGMGVSGLGGKYASGSTMVPQGRVFIIHNTFWTNQTWTDTDLSGLSGVSGAGQTNGTGLPTPSWYQRNNIYRMTRHAFSTSFVPANWDEDYNIFTTSDDTGRGMTHAGSVYTTNVAGYRTASGGGVNTNKVGGEDVAFTAYGRVDVELTDPANGALTLKVASAFIDAGVVVPNISDLSGTNYQGAAPDLGATEKA